MPWTAVDATTPVRVLDAGGWTDTWFAGTGRVCHLAVGPAVHVRARLVASKGPATVDLHVSDFGDRYRFAADHPPGRHPLLEATIRRWRPSSGLLEVELGSTVPPGCALGTSASVVVALIGALWSLQDRVLDPAAVARAAHAVEAEDLGWQTGVQDQCAAAFGGASLIRVDAYPHADVEALALADATWQALERRLLTVYLGRPHRSSEIHEAVLARLQASAVRDKLLDPLRVAAADAAEALVAGDLVAFGAAMSANTAAQEALHEGLVSPEARAVIAIARANGAAGWKVNGAGGDGGTVTIVGPDEGNVRIEAAVAESAPGMLVLRLPPSRAGLSVVSA